MATRGMLESDDEARLRDPFRADRAVFKMRALMRSELRALIRNCELLHTILTLAAEIHFQGAKLSSELKSHPKAPILPLLATWKKH